MTQILKQSTAVDVLIGPFVDLTDGATSETGESPTVKLSKNGQTLAAKNDITTPVHDADGYYNCELDATDTNTVGTLVLTVAKSATALPVRHEYQVIEEAIYDALIGASAAGFDANQRVDVGAWNGTSLGTTNPLPNAAPGATNGLLIAGTNSAATSFTAGVTISNASGSALTLTSSGGNGNGLNASGNGTGNGILGTGGATGAGIRGSGGNYGIRAQAGATGAGLYCVGGSTSGDGIEALATTSGDGISAVGVGAGVDISADITGDITGNLSGSVGSVTGSVGSVVGHTAQTGDSFARIGVAGAGLTDLGGMSTGMKAEVNAEVVDTLATDTYAEPGQETPGATVSLSTKIGYLYKFLRNRVTSTSTTISVYNDDGTTVGQKSTHSDDATTYDRGEFTTGP